MAFDDWAVTLTANKTIPNINEMKIQRAYLFFIKKNKMKPQTK